MVMQTDLAKLLFIFNLMTNKTLSILVVILFQVVLWQKAKVADNRSALLATLGPSAVASLIPCHHLQEQPEVS